MKKILLLMVGMLSILSARPHSLNYLDNPQNTFTYKFENGVLITRSNVEGAPRYYTRVHNKYGNTLIKLKVDYRTHKITGLENGETYIIKNAYYNDKTKQWKWTEVKVRLEDTYRKKHHRLGDRYLYNSKTDYYSPKRDYYNKYDRYENTSSYGSTYRKVDEIQKRDFELKAREMEIIRLQKENKRLQNENYEIKKFLKEVGYYYK
jgi:hypothetical protein